MTIKTVLKYMAVVGAVAIAAPSAYAQQAYINIGTDSGGPIIPAYGTTALPSYIEDTGFVDRAQPAYSERVAAPVAAPVTYPAESGYINIGTDSGGPIIPAHGTVSGPRYVESAGYAEPGGGLVYTGTAVDGPVVSPVMGYYPEQTYTNLGTDRGGPIFNLHSGVAVNYGAVEDTGSTPYYSEPMAYSAPAPYYGPLAYGGVNAETPAYYVPARGESGSPLIPVYR